MRRLTLLFLFWVIYYPLMGTIYYVKTDGNNSNSGTSWSEAKLTLQAALDLAVSGDQIWVKEGIYKPSYDYGLGGGSRYFHFRLKNGVSLFGGFDGSEPSNYDLSLRNFIDNETILSGDIGTPSVTTDNCYHIFYHPTGSALNNTAILDGFTIRDGNANGTAPHLYGGGFYSNNSSPYIKNIKFIDNYANWSGGGIFLTSCTSFKIENCEFRNNKVVDYYGGGLYMNSSTVNLINSLFTGNEAMTISGGALYSTGTSTISILNCIFRDNISVAGMGGAIYLATTAANITNSIIYGNYAYLGGGAIFAASTNCVITNSTICYNSAFYDGGALFIEESGFSANLRNSIIWGNTAGNSGSQLYIMQGSSVSADYCNYYNGTGYKSGSGSFNATNSLTTDPLFMDVSNDDYRILSTSPCVDAGNDSYNSESYDIRGIGYGRKLDKNDHTQVGTIDIGAYEFLEGTDGVSCTNPTSGGIIADAQTICNNTIPEAFTSLSLPSGYAGNLEYKWQSSSDSQNFTDIANSNSSTYLPSSLTQDTWFRRLSRVDCKTDWTGAAISNVLKITVNSKFTPGMIDGISYSLLDNTNELNNSPNSNSGSALDGNDRKKGVVFMTGDDDVIVNEITLGLFSYFNQCTVVLEFFEANASNNPTGNALMSKQYNMNLTNSTQYYKFTFDKLKLNAKTKYIFVVYSASNQFIWSTFNEATTSSEVGLSLLEYRFIYTGIWENSALINAYFINNKQPGEEFVCFDATPSEIKSSSDAKWGDGSITYIWQSSSVSESTDFEDIPNSNQSSYTPPFESSNPTWYRRLAKDGTCNTGFTPSKGVWKVTAIPQQVYLSSSFNSQTSGWGISHFSTLNTILSFACPGVQINISNFTHTGNIDLDGYTAIIGESDFTINGNISGGLIRTTNSGKLVQSAVQNSTRTFPVTDGTNNFTVTVTPTSPASSGNIGVKLNTGKSVDGSLVNQLTFWDIYGPPNLNATVTLRINKAVLGATTIPQNALMRFWNGTRYQAIPTDNVTISDQGTYYLITITGMNYFNEIPD